MLSANNLTMVLGAVVFVVALVVIVIAWNFFSAWLRAMFSNAPVSFKTLIALKLRKVPVALVVDQRITAVKAGIPVEADELSTHYLANGDITMVISALIAAQKAGIPLTFDSACAIDLATRQTDKNVLDAVMTSVNPRVIDCPDPKAGGRTTIDAVAKDGIQLRARARVTVRTNLKGFVGGATEETIIARVGEGIVTTIGSAETYKNVLENPDQISKTVMEKGLDSGTAFEILSVDVADVDVGENIGAKLQAEQAESNKLVAQAQAEVRRAAAVATEQEMKARVHEMRARVVEAEAQVPLAMADAFRSGNLGVMDYLRMKNLQADTGMRSSIGGAGDSGGDVSKK
jgi:uncharacterized protein YqfA (UPF0365 family)